MFFAGWTHGPAILPEKKVFPCAEIVMISVNNAKLTHGPLRFCYLCRKYLYEGGAGGVSPTDKIKDFLKQEVSKSPMFCGGMVFQTGFSRFGY